MWWILALVGALAVIAGLRLWFAPRPAVDLANNYTGPVTIACGVGDDHLHPVRRITYTASTTLLVRVDQQCNDEEPVSIALESTVEGGQPVPLVPPELLRGHTGFTFAVAVPANRTVRLSCGSSVTRHGDCRFYLQNATSADCNLQTGIDNTPPVAGRCGTEVQGRLYNLSGRILRVHVRWIGNACGAGGAVRLRFRPVDPAGTATPWSPPGAGNPLERKDESMDTGFYLIVQCMPASTADNCRFDVLCRRW